MLDTGQWSATYFHRQSSPFVDINREGQNTRDFVPGFEHQRRRTANINHIYNIYVYTFIYIYINS